MRGIPTDPILIATVERMFHEDKRVVEMMAETALPRRTVNNILRKRGLTRPLVMPPRRHDKETREAALALLGQYSCQEAAEIIGDGLRAWTVAKWAKVAGIGRKPGRRKHSEKYSKAVGAAEGVRHDDRDRSESRACGDP